MTLRLKHAVGRTTAVFAAIGLAATLTACSGGLYDMNTESPPIGFSVDENHPILVNQEAIELVIDVVDDKDEFKTYRSGKLRRFVDDYLARGSGAVMVETSRGVGGGRAEKVRGLLQEYGLRPDEVVVLGKRAAGKGRFLRLRFTGAKVYPPECLDWAKAGAQSYENTIHSDFGCSFRRNIGLMVANPNDLRRGRAADGHEANRSEGVIGDYRTGVAEKVDVEGKVQEGGL